MLILQVLQIINDALQFPDELLHAAIYDWMIKKNMSSEIIKIKCPSLQTFLMRSLKQSHNVAIMEIIWKYYENNNNHAAAAKILSDLASIPWYELF